MHADSFNGRTLSDLTAGRPMQLHQQSLPTPSETDTFKVKKVAV